jgi:hypothetical protein
MGIFAATSAAIVLLSWRSLRAPCSHGFYRFFAFELLLTLILLNVPDWFRDPLTLRQIVSWCLLATSLGLAIEGFRLLRRIGKPVRDACRPIDLADRLGVGALLAFENTTQLVTVGAYKFIRHPLYASGLAGAWGVCLKHPSVISLGLALRASAFLIATAIAEERENLTRFGAPYATYMKNSWRFVPFLF